jgi:predicted RNA-binding Zn-ribbon protein involved in translation (DUF1610 family)
METRKCPFCAEKILVEAIKCKHCGEFLKGIKKCEDCGSEMAEESKFCPVCGTMQLSGRMSNPKSSGSPKKKGIGWGTAILIIIVIVFLGNLLSKKEIQKTDKPIESQSNTSEVSSEWLPACMNIWSGVKIYYGVDKTYWGTVLDWSENYEVPYTGEKIRAVKIMMSDGSIEWKDRSVVICGSQGRQLFVRKDDPALR